LEEERSWRLLVDSIPDGEVTTFCEKCTSTERFYTFKMNEKTKSRIFERKEQGELDKRRRRRRRRGR